MQNSDYANTEFYFSHSDGEGVGCNGHYHDDYEIYYLKSGACDYFIDNAVYSIKAGDTVIIPSGIIHHTDYGTREYTRYLLNCPEKMIPKSALRRFSVGAHILRKKSYTAEIEDIMIKLGAEYDRTDEYTEDAVSSLVGRLFIHLARNADEKIESGAPHGFVEKVLQYVKSSYTSDITLESVAREFSVSAEHLSRSFKKKTGFGFSEYLNVLRLRHAEYMLIHEPGKSVSEIAYASGYNDSNYFSHKFKTSYGVTPSKYKSRACGE